MKPMAFCEFSENFDRISSGKSVVFRERKIITQKGTFTEINKMSNHRKVLMRKQTEKGMEFAEFMEILKNL